MKTIPALVVKQWLNNWEKVKFVAKEHRRKPEPHFYIFSMPASWLKSLSGIQRRPTKGGQLRSADLGIQRRHDENRSNEIREFVHYGYPWSELSTAKRTSGEFDNLRKPGWLPTSIVVNILGPDDERQGLKVPSKDLVTITISKSATASISLPDKSTSPSWFFPPASPSPLGQSYNLSFLVGINSCHALRNMPA